MVARRASWKRRALPVPKRRPGHRRGHRARAEHLPGILRRRRRIQRRVERPRQRDHLGRNPHRAGLSLVARLRCHSGWIARAKATRLRGGAEDPLPDGHGSVGSSGGGPWARAGLRHCSVCGYRAGDDVVFSCSRRSGRSEIRVDSRGRRGYTPRRLVQSSEVRA